MKPGQTCHDIRTGKLGTFRKYFTSKNITGSYRMGMVFWTETKKAKAVAVKYLRVGKPRESTLAANREAVRMEDLPAWLRERATMNGLSAFDALDAIRGCEVCQKKCSASKVV